MTAGQQVELAFDTSKLVIFDADTGINLTRVVETETPAEAPVEDAEPAAETPDADAQDTDSDDTATEKSGETTDSE